MQQTSHSARSEILTAGIAKIQIKWHAK